MSVNINVKCIDLFCDMVENSMLTISTLKWNSSAGVQIKFVMYLPKQFEKDNKHSTRNMEKRIFL